MSEIDYDEPGSRTRQAWLRSALGTVAVTILVERGPAVRGMPVVLGLAALAPAAAFIVVAARRSAHLGPRQSDGASRTAVALTAGAVLALAAAAAASVIVP